MVSTLNLLLISKKKGNNNTEKQLVSYIMKVLKSRQEKKMKVGGGQKQRHLEGNVKSYTARDKKDAHVMCIRERRSMCILVE
jgi:hypothetical protein